MDDSALLAQVKLRLPEIAGDAQDALLTALIADARAVVKALSWRDSVPDALNSAVIRLTVILYGRVGVEGERAHTEGEVSRVIDDLPESLKKEILAYRMAKT